MQQNAEGTRPLRDTLIQDFEVKHGPMTDRSNLHYTWALILSDLHRYAGNKRLSSFLRHYFFTPGFKYSTVMRLCGCMKRRALMRYALYPFFKLLLLRFRYKYGIAIPEYTQIGPGFFINRFGNIMVNGDAIIGANCNITHGSMLGQMNRGPKKGSPILGDGVFLAAGCKVIGKIHIGSRSAVGANAVVNKDVPDDAAVGGIPAKILSMKGSEGYINRRVSDDYRTGFQPIEPFNP